MPPFLVQFNWPTLPRNHWPFVRNYHTRGLDRSTYIPTRLDTALKEDVLHGKKKLVVLTGNAGDGKTAFIQLIEESAEKSGGTFHAKTDNGCRFSYNGSTFETLYDGSQDFEGKSNDLLLKEFFKALEGENEPTANIVKIIAINEGKLRDFILFKKEYKWLGNQVHHYLEKYNYALPNSLAFINLNNRAIVESNNPKSIFDELLNILLDTGDSKKIWEPCQEQNCAYAKSCYVKYNVDSLRDQKKGAVVKQRLKELILSIYLKKEKHITMRDIRSLISFIIFNKYTCSQLQADIDAGVNLLGRFYYNNAFNKDEMDRMVSILSKVDVADMPLPKLENHLYLLNPKTEINERLTNKAESGSNPDLNYLEKYFINKPEGTSDNDEIRKANADLFLSAMKRKLYFEGNDDYLEEQFAINHYSFLPYRHFKRFIEFLATGNDQQNELRNDIVLAISKSEKIYNDEVGRENVCISSNSVKKSTTKAFYGFTAADFEVVLPDVGYQTNYIEYFPDHIIFRHTDETASLEINIDLFEILMRIKEGYVPTSIEIRTFFLNLEMFKRRILAKRSTTVFLTEDDTSLYEFKKSASGKLVLSKM
ncbi:MAG: ATP-binding protein [Haliscomenobacter sp.]|nr:ATP-binding protein [Haliscomenobacter sp.]